MSFSSDGRYVASGSGYGDKTVKIWEIQTNKCLSTLARSHRKDMGDSNKQTNKCLSTLQGHLMSV